MTKIWRWYNLVWECPFFFLISRVPILHTRTNSIHQREIHVCTYLRMPIDWKKINKLCFWSSTIFSIRRVQLHIGARRGPSNLSIHHVNTRSRRSQDKIKLLRIFYIGVIISKSSHFRLQQMLVMAARRRKLGHYVKTEQLLVAMEKSLCRVVAYDKTVADSQETHTCFYSHSTRWSRSTNYAEC